jgi:enediyne biosynthesis protein E4
MPFRRLGRFLFGVALAGFAGGCQRDGQVAPASVESTAPAWFEDITARSGLEFMHDSGAAGTYFMPESIGSGGALFDFDNDGRLDLYLVHHAAPGSKSKNRLYHQESDGRFRDVSDGSGLDVSGYGMGVATGDFNNDGLPDVLLTEYGAVRLFLNRAGGRFEDVTREAGIENTRWATSAAFFDYDRDGWLDLVIVNYVDYSPTIKCYDTRGAIEYCGPQGMQGTATRLFHNRGRAGEGGARFEDATLRSGIAQKVGSSLGVFCADFDGDHWPDIFITDDGQPNRLYMNQRNGTFTEEAAVRGIAFNAFGNTAANMGIAVGDVDGDGLFDLFVTHLMWEQHALWKQGPRGLFQDQVATVGLTNLRWRGTAFGTLMGDFDRDGALDLALVNGLIKRGNDPGPFHAGMNPFWRPYAVRAQLFANDGQGRFQEVSQANPAFCGAAAVGRGLACGDIDNDGALDLLAVCTGAPARLFRNIAPQRGHWLMIRAIEPACGGRDAYGAEITLEAGGRRWVRLVQPGYSFLVSNDPRVHFGLGALTAVDRIHIVWPEGQEEVFAGGPVDRSVVLQKGSGKMP